MASAESWQRIAREAQTYRNGTVTSPLIQPPVPEVPTSLPLDVRGVARQLLTAAEVRLTELAAEELAANLAEGNVSAVTVAQAFLRRAGLAQRLVNCATELLPEAALGRARELDEHLRLHGRPVGPLHGVPVSVKEHVQMRGRGLDLAYVRWYGRTARTQAFPLRCLHDAGAVFYVRTTEPQTIMHLETSSNLYGVTVNPWNTNLSSGGSSGGEGALIAMRGSCLGIGSDIGGSIRSPAGNCGVFGLRPTANRLSYLDVDESQVGPDVAVVQGPLSTSLEGIRMYCRAMLAGQPWIRDNAVVPLPWKELPAIKRGDRLRIGVMWHDDVVKPHPPVMRALKMVEDGLKNVFRVDVFDFKAYKHDHGWDIISSLYFPDGADAQIGIMDESGEPLRPLTKWLLKEEGHVKRLSVEDLWHWQSEREAYLKEYNRKWLETGDGNDENIMDVILCPYFPGASAVFDTSKYWAYTSTWNLVDYPALVFPVTTVDPRIDVVEKDFVPMTDKDAWNHRLYDPETFKGAPVSLQLVGRRYEEERLVAIAEFIGKELKLPLSR